MNPSHHFHQLVEHFEGIYVGKAKAPQGDHSLVEHPFGISYTYVTPTWLHAMHALVEEINSFRRKERLPDFTFEDLAFHETEACGHFDYTSKLAIICAEAAHGRVPKTARCTHCGQQVLECKPVDWAPAPVCGRCEAEHRRSRKTKTTPPLSQRRP